MKWNSSAVVFLIKNISKLMTEKREELIALDSAIGDGDLGITMDKAFSTAAAAVEKMDENVPGRLLMQVGIVMAKSAPSTMGTLIATGFMHGGKALGTAEIIDGEELYRFFNAFLEAVMQRGKAKKGDKTLIDVLDPVVNTLAQSKDQTILKALKNSFKAAIAGVEATKTMISQHGKAAIYREQTLGKVDPGSMAIMYIIKGFLQTAEYLEQATI